MAHIPDGVLSLPVIAIGSAVAVGCVAIGLRQMDERDVPRTAILTAAFFVSALISIPIGVSSIHLLLSGLMGLILGARAFPAVLVALVLQALLFGFGGLTTLGVNTVNIALPGVVLGTLFGSWIAGSGSVATPILAGAMAALCVALTAAGVSLSLALSSPDYVPSAKIIIATYVPLMVIEALVTAFIISFLKRVKPELLPATGAPS